jgi:hypothetical protein
MLTRPKLALIVLHHQSKVVIHKEFFSEGIKGRDHVLDLGVEGMIMSIWILHNMGGVVD